MVNGLLSFYDNETNKFKTIYVHHIETNYNHDIDTYHVLKDHYNTTDKVLGLFSHGFISYFTGSEIGKDKDCEKPIETDSIDELIELSSEWHLSTHYVFYNNCWFHSPLDVKNIYYEKDNPDNQFEEYWDYDTKIDIYNYFVSTRNIHNGMYQNTKVSKVVIFHPLDKEPLVLCISRHDLVAGSVSNQIDYIYEKLTKENPALKNATWYDFDPRPLCFLDYVLSEVEFTDTGSPCWNENISLKKISNENGVSLDIIESLITKYSR